MFAGDFDGALQELNSVSRKLRRRFALQSTIWSICLLGGRYVLGGGDEQIWLVDRAGQARVKQVSLESLGPGLSHVIYRMDFVDSDAVVRHPRVICRTSGRPCVIHLRKLQADLGQRSGRPRNCLLRKKAL